MMYIIIEILHASLNIQYTLTYLLAMVIKIKMMADIYVAKSNNLIIILTFERSLDSNNRALQFNS